MAAVSIFEGNTEHRFDVPPGYRPIVRAGRGELVIDPDYRPREVGGRAVALAEIMDNEAESRQSSQKN